MFLVFVNILNKDTVGLLSYQILKLKKNVYLYNIHSSLTSWKCYTALIVQCMIYTVINSDNPENTDAM